MIGKLGRTVGQDCMRSASMGVQWQLRRRYPRGIVALSVADGRIGSQPPAGRCPFGFDQAVIPKSPAPQYAPRLDAIQ
jgi:hypothetical protein